MAQDGGAALLGASAFERQQFDLRELAQPVDALDVLNRYYAIVTPIIHAHGGTIDNFRGDGLIIRHSLFSDTSTEGVYVIGFCYPVVPQGAARIRVQVSAVHTRADLDFALEAFSVVKRELEA